MKSHREITPTAIRPDHRRPVACRGRLLAVPRAAEDRWADQLCDHAAGSAWSPRSIPGTSPSSGRPPVPSRRDRRLPQQPAACGGAAPHHRDPRRPLRLQGRQQPLRRSDAPHALAAGRGAVGARAAWRCRVRAPCTRRSRRPCSAGSWRCCWSAPGRPSGGVTAGGNRGHRSARTGAVTGDLVPTRRPRGRQRALGADRRRHRRGRLRRRRRLAKTRPTATSVTHQVHYTQNGRIDLPRDRASRSPCTPAGHSAPATPSSSSSSTASRIKAAYRFAADAPARLQGTQQVLLQLTGPTGWTRQIALSRCATSPVPAITTPAAIDLRAVQALLDQVQKATGIPADRGEPSGSR